MALADPPPILAQLTSARSCAEQIAALKALKNDVIGHIQKKEQWVELGVLEPLVRVLDADRPQTQLNGKSSRGEAQRALGEEEQLRLHALELLAAFASGGPPFLFPLHAVDALSVILSNVDPTETHPKLVLAALRALLNLSEASLLAAPLSPYDTTSLATEIFTPRNLEALRAILSSSDDSLIQASLVNAAASLIARLCKDEQHQVALADTGVLDALATQLAGFIVAKGHVIPGADVAAQNEGLSGGIPNAASPGTSLLTIMDAISAVIADSRLRACMLIHSPPILSTLPHIKLDTPSQDIPAIWNSLYAQGLSTYQWQNFGAMDFLLPAVPGHHTRFSASQISSFPPLGTSHSRENLSGYQQNPSGRLDVETSKWGTSFLDILNQIGDRSLEEPESPLIPWLFTLVRESEELERFMAASILSSLYKAGFASRSREPALAMLIVPLLLHTLYLLGPEIPQNGSTWIDSEAAEDWDRTQLTLTVLARLVTDSELVQKAAFECDAVKVVGKLLKDSYEPLNTRSQPKTWSPCPQDDSAMAAEGGPGHRVLGPPGQLALHAYRAKLRESALKAVAAIVSFKEEYRKAFVEEDVMPYIVESLTEHPTKPSKSKDRAKSSKDGSELTAAQAEALYGNNPISVLIAACHTIRMLSRSVSILRTALVDAGVAQPIFNLLRHPELEVQVAATGAICNLVLDVSPMKERLVELGIMKVLCEHAHSQHAPLRLNALWALKHFVDGVGAETKKACVDELEPGWLVRLICDDTEDEALYARMKSERQTPAPRGDGMDEDVEMDQEEEARSWGSSSLHRASFPKTSHERTKTLRVRQAESRLAALREAELNPVRRARSDDLAIQEQGLDFIRNLLGPAGSSNMDAQQETTEMIDYLFSELGQDRLFGILASKLRVKVLHPFGRRTAAGVQNSRVLYPQPKIVEAVMYVLVHIAASVPRHRQLVIAQTDLLKLLSNHFTNKDKNVRLALCHLMANLTWRDGTTDTQSSSQRAHELKRLGMLSKIEKLAADDAELDVRERAKSAKWQISQSNNEY